MLTLIFGYTKQVPYPRWLRQTKKSGTGLGSSCLELGSNGCGHLCGLATLYEDIPADTSKEEERGGDLAGLGNPRWSDIDCDGLAIRKSPRIRAGGELHRGKCLARPGGVPRNRAAQRICIWQIELVQIQYKRSGPTVCASNRGANKRVPRTESWEI